VRWVADHVPKGMSAHPSSRLDLPVSGLVTFTLSRRANRHLLAARQAGAYQRDYIGIAAQPALASQGEWTWPIAIDPSNPRRRIAGGGRGEREASTHFDVLRSLGRATLLHLRPVTGRTHQLRVHAARAGVPLFGDHAYGGPRRIVLDDGRVVTAHRVMLHCLRVRFPRLDGKGGVELTADPPHDMVEVWTALGGEASALEAIS